jgi:hypothetical protein
MKSPLTSSAASKSTRATSRLRIARQLFCSDKFAIRDFKEMDVEDWKLHAFRAWEVAGIFVSETKRRKKQSGLRRENETESENVGENSNS